MIGGLVIIFLSGIISFSMIKTLKNKYRFIDSRLMKQLFFFHLLLAVVYYLYALFNPSDSWAYFSRVNLDFRGEGWAAYYGTSTTFIEFIGYPFIKFFGFSYEATMALFAFFG